MFVAVNGLFVQNNKTLYMPNATDCDAFSDAETAAGPDSSLNGGSALLPRTGNTAQLAALHLI
jgi:hypothetical protein